MLPTHRHLVCHAWFHWSRASGASPTTPIAGFVVASARGSFKPCAVGVDGAVPGDRVLSRMPLAALHVARPTCAVAAAPCRVARGAWRNSRLTPAVCVKPASVSQAGGDAHHPVNPPAAERPRAATGRSAPAKMVHRSLSMVTCASPFVLCRRRWRRHGSCIGARDAPRKNSLHHKQPACRFSLYRGARGVGE